MSVTPLVLPEGNFRAFLFDLDGTLADSMPLHFVVWTKAVTEAGGQFPEDLFYALGGVPPLRIVELLNEKYGTAMSPEDVVARKEALYLDMLDQVQPTLSVLAHVHAERGRLKLAVVSGSPRHSIERTLAALGITDAFETIVGAEDYTHGKPDPEPFLTAAARLNVAPADCLVFEDAEAGIASAKAAGMSWVRVPQQYVAVAATPTA